jgi:hypothetical protein
VWRPPCAVKPQQWLEPSPISFMMLDKGRLVWPLKARVRLPMRPASRAKNSPGKKRLGANTHFDGKQIMFPHRQQLD